MAYYVPGIVLRAFHLLIYSILTTLEVGTILPAPTPGKGTERRSSESGVTWAGKG